MIGGQHLCLSLVREKIGSYKEVVVALRDYRVRVTRVIVLAFLRPYIFVGKLPVVMADVTRKPSLPEEKLEVINDTHGTHIDAVAEKKLLRKCDIRVLPPLFVLFLLAFLDRTNIGMHCAKSLECLSTH